MVTYQVMCTFKNLSQLEKAEDIIEQVNKLLEGFRMGKTGLVAVAGPAKSSMLLINSSRELNQQQLDMLKEKIDELAVPLIEKELQKIGIKIKIEKTELIKKQQENNNCSMEQ
jgi:hypothetical protein